MALAFWLIDVSLSAWSIWELSADAGSAGGYIQLGSLPPGPESISTIDRLRVVALGSVGRGGFYLLTFAVCYGLVLHFTLLLDNDES